MMLLVLLFLFVALSSAFIAFREETANSSILVFGGSVLQNAGVTTGTVAGLSVDGQIVQAMVDSFEKQYGELSQHLVIDLVTTNPIYSAIHENVKFVLDPGAQQFVLSLSVASKLQLPMGLPCISKFGDGVSLIGYKSFVILSNNGPAVSGLSPFPVGIAVCVQDTSWNLLSGTFLTIADRCQCKAPGRVGLYGCANNGWI